jgi:hypothetical protein
MGPFPNNPNDSWAAWFFFLSYPNLRFETGWGCGGVAAWRAGVPINPKSGRYDPLDILKVSGVQKCNTFPAALAALKAIGGKGVIIAVQSHVANWTSQPGCGNFLTFLGTYWEWANHGDSTPGRRIYHAPSQANWPTGFDYTVYYVVQCKLGK